MGLTRPVLSVHWKSCSTILSLSPIQVFSCPKPGEKSIRGGPRHRHPRGWGAPRGAAAPFPPPPNVPILLMKPCSSCEWMLVRCPARRRQSRSASSQERRREK